MNENRHQMPLIGEMAPSFVAQTTEGEINFPENYRGKWVILFSHPADFTPVCTTEFMAFQRKKEKFDKLNTKLIGLSVDELESHKAWLQNISEKIDFEEHGLHKIEFPIIVDSDAKVAKMYGMLQPSADNTKTVRAVFMIDPKGIVRAILYYPMSNGRNIKEILRLLKAMQTTDAFDAATPANWEPGDDVIIPPSEECKKTKSCDKNLPEGATCYDWYLCTKKLSKDEIEQKIKQA